jgi:hypothetical protein
MPHLLKVLPLPRITTLIIKPLINGLLGDIQGPCYGKYPVLFKYLINITEIKVW